MIKQDVAFNMTKSIKFDTLIFTVSIYLKKTIPLHKYYSITLEANHS